MSTMWLDDTDTESGEYDDSDFSEYDDSDSEDFDGESRASAARQRQARQRRTALAQRRQAQARARSTARSRQAPVSRSPGQRETVSAIRNLDLETKVQEDTFRGAITNQNKRMSRSEYAAVTGAAVNQFIESFEDRDDPYNPYVKAALRFAPLLLLSPQRRRTGVEGFLLDPRVIGAAAVAGITVVGDNRNRFAGSQEIRITAVSELPSGSDIKFFAEVFDGKGRATNATVTWGTTDPKRATVDADGMVKAVGKGPLFIEAKVDGLPIKRVPLVVS